MGVAKTRALAQAPHIGSMSSLATIAPGFRSNYRRRGKSISSNFARGTRFCSAVKFARGARQSPHGAPCQPNISLTAARMRPAAFRMPRQLDSVLRRTRANMRHHDLSRGRRPHCAFFPEFPFRNRLPQPLSGLSLPATVFTQVSGLLGLLPAAVFLILTGTVTTAPNLLGALFIYTFGRGICDCNGRPVVCDVVEEDQRSTAYSLLNFAGTFAGVVAAYGAGALRSVIGLDGALLGAGVIILLSAALLARIPTPSPLIPHTD